MKRNNNNKKAFVLLEAIIAIILLLFALVLSGETLLTNIKTNTIINEAILKLNSKNVFNQINYIKSILIAKGKNTFYLKNNEPYAGWNILKVTPNSSFNDLNGYYVIEQGPICNSTSIGEEICLRKTQNNEMSFFRIKGESNKTTIDENGKVNEVINSKTNKDSVCDIRDLGDTCLGYKLYIENLTNATAYKKISYIRSDGVTVVLNSNKLVTLELIGLDQKVIKKYKHLLNIY